MKLEDFRNPGKEFRGVPFWSWNDDLTDLELARQVREMKEKGLGGFFMHSRIGLITPYLSREWMDRVKATVREAELVGMDAWLYDEDRWPSGFAGGIVPAKGFEYRQRRLECREFYEGVGFKADGDTVKVFLCKKEGGRVVWLEDVTGRGLQPSMLKDTFILSFRKVVGESSSWYNNYSYVDTLNPKVVDAFIESTYEAYHREVGDYFGRVIPGIFTDEPNYWIGGGGSVPWTDRFPEYFKDRNGYDVLDVLPSLFYDVGDYLKIRYDFWSAVTDLFLESYSKKLYEWCGKHNLKYTGHYLCEDNLTIQTRYIGAAMPHYEYMHIPGIDHLGRNIADLITVKQVSSVAHQLGKERVLSETYGCSGWNLTFEGQKWIGDWEYVLGVNLLNQHLCLYSMKGCRKRDYPPSLYYQQPWWKYHKKIADYFARLSYALTRGRFVADILVIHPVRSAWSVYSPNDIKKVEELNKSFCFLSEALCALHRDYDYGDEKLMEKYGDVYEGKLVIGQGSYKLVLIPPSITLKEGTLELLEKFIKAGGKVIAVKPTPTLVNCRESERLKAFFKASGVVVIEQGRESLKKALDEALPPDVQIVDEAGVDIESIYYQHREDDGRHIYFFANIDRERGFEALIRLRELGSLEEWCLEDGEVVKIPYERKGDYTQLKLTFPPVGSHLIVLSKVGEGEEVREGLKARVLSIAKLNEEWGYRRNDPNALTLDYCQYKVYGGEWSGKVPVWKVQRELERLDREVDVSLRFIFTTKLSRRGGDIYLVLERPEIYAIKVNGEEVKYQDSGYWVDISFRKINISSYVKEGENVVELACLFKKPTLPNTLIYTREGVELESCYIIGDFAVAKVDGHSFYLTDERPKVRIGDLVEQGYPFYAGSFTYIQDVVLNKKGRTFIELEGVDAVTVKVKVNDVEAGVLAWHPYKIDATNFIKEGVNKIELELTNSCRNLLGPHHHKAGELYSVGPESFTDEKNWVDTYSFVKFGLTGGVKIIQEHEHA